MSTTDFQKTTHPGPGLSLWALGTPTDQLDEPTTAICSELAPADTTRADPDFYVRKNGSFGFDCDFRWLWFFLLEAKNANKTGFARGVSVFAKPKQQKPARCGACAPQKGVRVLLRHAAETTTTIATPLQLARRPSRKVRPFRLISQIKKKQALCEMHTRVAVVHSSQSRNPPFAEFQQPNINSAVPLKTTKFFTAL